MFCKYCGSQYPDDGVCNCAEATAARAAAAAPVATAEAPAANDIGKVAGDAFKGMPGTFKTLLNNTNGDGISLPSAVILAVGGLVLNILAWVCIIGGLMGSLKDAAGAMVWTYISKVFSGIYGFGILGGLWTCIIPIALSMVIAIVGQLIRKEQVAIVPAFVTGASIHAVPAALFLVGALISMLIPVIGILVILVGIVFALAGVYKQMAKLVANTNGLVGGIIAAAVVAVVFGLMAWVVYGVIAGYIEGPLTKNIATVMGGAIGDIGDILGSLLG